jgi:hypothetical protein
LTLAELPMPVQGYILWDVVRFPRGSVKTHHPNAIHPFSMDEGKPHMTPWGWGVGPWSPTYLETDLPQGQVPGYPPPADVPGSHSSLGLLSLNVVSPEKDQTDLLCTRFWHGVEKCLGTGCDYNFHAQFPYCFSWLIVGVHKSQENCFYVMVTDFLNVIIAVFLSCKSVCQFTCPDQKVSY